MRATNVVLALLCVMYFINYVVRVNVNTAALVFKDELHLSNTQVGLIFSAFAYPYLLFQIAGGWIADKFGARRTLAERLTRHGRLPPEEAARIAN